MAALEEPIAAPPGDQPSFGDGIDAIGMMVAGGLITLGALGLCVTLCLSMWMIPSQQPVGERVGLTALACLVAAAEAWSVYFAYRYVQHDPAPPFLVKLALAQPRWPLLLR